MGPQKHKIGPDRPGMHPSKVLLFIFIEYCQRKVAVLDSSDRKLAIDGGGGGEISPRPSPPPGCATAAESAQIYIVYLHTY